MDNENGAGISFLFAKLCEIAFKQEASRNFDIYRRPRFNNRKREALKLCLYETLFDELRAPWVGEITRPKQKCIKDLDDNSPFCTKDKLAIAAFKLRLARRFDDADKLDELVCQWSKCAGKCAIWNFSRSVQLTSEGSKRVRYRVRLSIHQSKPQMCACQMSKDRP